MAVPALPHVALDRTVRQAELGGEVRCKTDCFAVAEFVGRVDLDLMRKLGSRLCPTFGKRLFRLGDSD